MQRALSISSCPRYKGNRYVSLPATVHLGVNWNSPVLLVWDSRPASHTNTGAERGGQEEEEEEEEGESRVLRRRAAARRSVRSCGGYDL